MIRPRRIPLSRRKTVRDTLQIMVTLVKSQRDEHRVRDTAICLTEGCKPLDDACRMQKILAWARNVIRYERDARGGEYLSQPVEMIERVVTHGNTAGDCDDGAVLISALLEALGIPTRFVAVSIRKDRKLHHVAVEAKDRSGFWVYLDPFRRGSTAPFTRTMRVNV